MLFPGHRLFVSVCLSTQHHLFTSVSPRQAKVNQDAFVVAKPLSKCWRTSSSWSLRKKNKSCRVLPSFVMISDISIKPICLALPTTLFLLCCLRGVQFLCVENSAKFAKLRFSFTERELVNCAGSTKMVQSYLLDAPHGAWAGHASICKGISRLC